MTIDGIRGILPVSLDQNKHEEERKKRKKSNALQGISSELSRALSDLCVWITTHPLASIMELNLDDSSKELQAISSGLNAAHEDLSHYLGVIPENQDNDIAEEMLRVLDEDMIKVRRATLCTYKENPSFSFASVLEKAKQLDEKEVSIMLFHLFQEIDESSWKEVKKLFTELMKKCA